MFTNFAARFGATPARAHSIRAMLSRQDMLVLLLLHYAIAKDLPKQTNYVTRRIDSCPAVGYFFKREMVRASLPGPCFLCFCQDDNTAVCWQRENKRCDAEHYHHHGVGKRSVSERERILRDREKTKRDARRRRSPAGFSDIFFRDATRDMFNKQSPEQCKPYESSFSEGCPPADWCIGCTVCDCDSNGRWDCHILSFCPEKDKPKPKKPKGRLRKKMYRRREGSVLPPRDNHPKRSHRRRFAKKLTVKATKKPKTTKKPSPKPQRNKNQKSPPFKVKRPPPTRRPIAKEVIKKQNRARQIVSRKNLAKKIQTSTTEKQLVKRKAPQREKRRLITTSVTPRATPPPPKISTPVNTPQLTQDAGKEIVQSFMTTIQDMMAKQIEKQIEPLKPKQRKRNKRSLVKEMVLQKHLLDTTRQNINYSKSLDLPGTKKQKKHVDFGASLEQNRRYKRDVATGPTTTQNSSTMIDTERNTSYVENIIDLKTENPLLTTNSMFKYYKYSLDKSIENTTLIDRYNYEYTNKVGADLPKNVTVKRSLNLLHKGDTIKGNQETFLRLMEGENTSISINESKKNASLPRVEHTSTLKPNMELKGFKLNHFPIEKAVDQQIVNVFMKNHHTIEGNIPFVADTSILNLNSTKSHNQTNTAVMAKKITRKVMERARGSMNKKYKLTKIVNTLKKTRLNRNADVIKVKLGNGKQVNQTKPAEFKNFFKKLFNGFSNSNKTRRSKTHRFKVIKYLQKFFRRMFFKSKNKTQGMIIRNYTKLRPMDKNNVIENLCESFGPCHVSSKNQAMLLSKVDNLSNETYKMLSTIQVIKGLLRLVDFAKNDRDLKEVDIKKNRTNFESDIQKLHAILRGSYNEEEHVKKLTSTQKTQIDYIKSNTQTFIQLAGKFANTLNEIIDLISVPSEKKKNKRVIRYAKKEQIKVIDKEPFQKLKTLLLKYNMLQNAFMKKIYKVLSSMDVYTTAVTTETYNNTSKIKNSSLRNSNTTEAIQTYTKNILWNLKKLKHLAQKLDSTLSRRKRDLRDGDSTEYLLMLMEYLLKHNNPSNDAPVNDGIDLIIEAIKQAPEIKQIKKKVLNVNSFITKITTTTTTTTTTLRPLKILKTSKEDSTLDLQKISNEDNLNSKQDYLKVEHSFDESVDNEDKYVYYRKTNSEKIKKTTTADYVKDNRVSIGDEDKSVYNRKTNGEKMKETTTADYTIDNEGTQNTKMIKVITEAPIDEPYESPGPIYKAPYESNERDDFFNLEKKFDTNATTDTSKSVEVFNADIEEEEETSNTTVAGVIETESTTLMTETSTQAPNIKEAGSTTIKNNKDKGYTVRHFQFDDNFMSQSNKKLKLDWLDETYEEEVKTEMNQANASLPVKLAPQAATTKYANDSQKTIDNVSSITKEIEEEIKEKTRYKGIIKKKEMNLLNSLDYVTDKSEVENSESKETPRDKYSDSFGSYFN